MQPIDPDYFKAKSDELGLDRAIIIERVQRALDQLYPTKTHVISLNRGTLKIITPSAPVASELRLNQSTIIRLAPDDIERLQIVIGQT